MRHCPQFATSPFLVSCAAALVLAAPASAQERRIIVGGAGDAGHVIGSSFRTVTLPDSVIRGLVERNLPEALVDDGDARHVSLVIDANDQYVSGRVSKATVLTRTSADLADGQVLVAGDTTGGAGLRVMFRRVDGDNIVSTGGRAVTVVRTGDGIDGTEFSAHAATSVLGSNYSPSDVASVAIKRFAPGELGRGTVLVSVIKLK